MAKKNTGLVAVAIVLMLVVVGIGAAFAMGYLQKAPPASAYTEKAAFDYSMAESCFVVPDLDNVNGARIYAPVSFNDTSDAFVSSTNVITLNFTISRDDAVEGSAMAYCSIGAVPYVAVTGAASEPILSKTGNDFSAAWTKTGIATTFYEEVRVSIAEGSSAYATVVITLSADALAAMSQYQSIELPIYVAGHSIILDIEKATVVT